MDAVITSLRQCITPSANSPGRLRMWKTASSSMRGLRCIRPPIHDAFAPHPQLAGSSGPRPHLFTTPIVDWDVSKSVNTSVKDSILALSRNHSMDSQAIDATIWTGARQAANLVFRPFADPLP